MTDRKTDPTHPNAPGNTVKDPKDWTTGDEPMTGAQRSYLKTLCHEANEPMDETLTKAQASERIAELQQRTGRGAGRAGWPPVHALKGLAWSTCLLPSQGSPTPFMDSCRDSGRT
jgi:hypothetical protein